MSVFGLFDVGKTALQTTRRALDTTAHNVANASTPGYTRQEVIFENIPLGTVVSTGISGRGIRIAEIKRLYDSFTSLQLISEKSNLSYWESYQKGIVKIENIFNESPESSLGKTINDFFHALQEVAQNPEGAAQRMALLKVGEYLSSRISRAYVSLDDERTEIYKTSHILVSEVNTIAKKIAALNEKISASPGALDLKDQRDVLVERLNQILKVTTFEDNSGKYTVLVNSVPLVDGGKAYEMTVATDSNDDMRFYMKITNVQGTVVETKDITSFITGGELKANLDMRDTDIASYMNKLNAFAHDLTLTVNYYHESGYGLDGSTGNSFFKEISPTFVYEDSKSATGGSVTAIDITNLERVNFEKRYKIDYNTTGGTNYQEEGGAGASGIYWRVQESTDGVSWTAVKPEFVRIVVDTAASPDTRSLEFNGVKVTISGNQADLFNTVVEEFDIKPNPNAAREMAMAITDTQKIAAASGDLDTRFTITDNNKTLSINQGNTTININLQSGTYTRFGLAAELQRAINAANFNVTVTFDAQTNKFKIVNNAPNIITLNWTSSITTLEDIFGFNEDSVITQNGFDMSDLEVKAGTVLIDSSNNTIRFSEDNGATYVTATIPLGTYTRRELAEVLEQALEDANSGTSYNYTVSYNVTTKQYTITNSGTNTNPSTIIFDWTHSSTTADGVFGFSSNSLITTNGSDTSDYHVYPILPGDNTNARILANLAFQNIISSKNPSDYYRSIVSEVGVDAQSAKTNITFHTTLVEELERKRQELSGVSLDEEAANLLRYQRSFEAAAKMINVADELLDTLINKIRG